MLDKKWRIIVFCLLVFPLMAQASDYVYSWIDEDGVRIFSDKAPVVEVKNLEKYEKIISSPDSGASNSNKSISFDSSSSNEDSVQEEEAGKTEEKLTEDETPINTNPEIEKLEKEIENIEKRALGPRYSQGMKDNQIEIIKKKIETLKEKQ